MRKGVPVPIFPTSALLASPGAKQQVSFGSSQAPGPLPSGPQYSFGVPPAPFQCTTCPLAENVNVSPLLTVIPVSCHAQTVESTCLFQLWLPCQWRTCPEAVNSTSSPTSISTPVDCHAQTVEATDFPHDSLLVQWTTCPLAVNATTSPGSISTPVDCHEQSLESTLTVLVAPNDTLMTNVMRTRVDARTTSLRYSNIRDAFILPPCSRSQPPAVASLLGQASSVCDFSLSLAGLHIQHESTSLVVWSSVLSPISQLASRTLRCI